MFNDITGDSARVPENLFDSSPIGPYKEGYSQEGLNLQDWQTFSQGIFEVSGISLATPSKSAINLEIASIDESVGSELARDEYKHILNNKKKHQKIIIKNNNPDVLGAQNITQYLFDKEDNILGPPTDYNAGVMNIDLEDFKQWQKINLGKPGTVDPRALDVGLSFLHENLHNRGVGTFGLTMPMFSKADLETPVINQINAMRQQMKLPSRLSHSICYDKTGGYIPFSNGLKYYIK